MKTIDLGNGGVAGAIATAECTIYENGSRYWHLNSERHRTDGPAIEYADGSKYWFINDKLHRTDGPAIEFANGNKYWFINDIEYSEEEFDVIKEILWII